MLAQRLIGLLVLSVRWPVGLYVGLVVHRDQVGKISAPVRIPLVGTDDGAVAVGDCESELMTFWGWW